MRRVALLAFAGAVIPAAVLAVGVVASSPGQSSRAKKQSAGQVSRGKYLVTIMACADCHTPHDQLGRPIAAMNLAGHPARSPLPQWDPSLLQKNAVATISPTMTAFAGPFGVSVSGNLTPDKDTGIGKLTAEGLIKSWRTGKHWRENRAVLPPMPIAKYKSLTDSDIRAIHAYLMTLKPIPNRAPQSVPAKPPAP